MPEPPIEVEQALMRSLCSSSHGAGRALAWSSGCVRCWPSRAADPARPGAHILMITRATPISQGSRAPGRERNESR